MHAVAADVSMSVMTSKIVAMEVVGRVKPSMKATPKVWLQGLDVVDYARRLGQTIRYLQTCYAQLPDVLPPGIDKGSGRMSGLLQDLDRRCNDMMEAVNRALGSDTEVMEAVPKFYFSELRRRRSCSLPQAPDVLPPSGTLSFCAIEAVGFLRRVERSDRLSSGEYPPSLDTKEAWQSLSQLGSSAVTEIVATMVALFGEERTEAELRRCVIEEDQVIADLFDGSAGQVRFNGVIAAAAMPAADEDDDEDEDDDDLDDTCPVFTSKPVYIVSDCTGESAERTVQSALGQFGHCFDRSSTVDITTFRFVNEGMITGIVDSASRKDALVVFTLVDPICNKRMVDACAEKEVKCHDLWTPLLEQLEGYFHTNRTGVPGRKQFADDKYMKLIDCIEYTRKLDDGVLPHLWGEADIMIVGPSRAGKTPLSFFMAQRGFKVANYPLVRDESIPRELYDFPQHRVFALTISPQKLSMIRGTRMKTLKMSTSTSYANAAKVTAEVNWCNNLYRQNPGWTVLDTTEAGIEEICARILFKMEVRHENPSAI